MSNEARAGEAKTTSDTSVAASLTQTHGSPWAWLPLSLLLSISIVWLLTDTFTFRFAPDIFVVILAGWLASRFGPKIIGFMMALSLLSVFGLEAELSDRIVRMRFGISDAAFFLALCAAMAFSRPALSTATSAVSSEKWRWLKWLLPIALWIAIFADRGPYLGFGDNISIGINVGFALTAILLVTCADRIAVAAIYRSLFLASGRRLHKIVMSLVVALIPLAFVLYADFELFDSVQANFGFRDSLAAMTVLAFALPAWGIVDWRIMIAILVVCFAGDWAVTWAIDTITAAFPAEPVVPTSSASLGDGGGLEEIVVRAVRRPPWLPQPGLVYGICATLLAVAITPFWRTRDPKSVISRDAGIFLLLVLVVFYVGSIVSSLGQNAISLMLLGGVAYVMGLVWRVRGIIAGPLIIQFCHLLSVAVFFPKYYMFGIAASDMFAIGLIAFPCAFFGYLSNRYVAPPSDSDSKQATYGVLQ